MQGRYVYSLLYAVPTISRLLQIISLFCKRALWKRRYSAEETYVFKEPTNRSHPILGDKPAMLFDHLLQIIGLFCKRALQKRRYSGISLIILSVLFRQ